MPFAPTDITIGLACGVHDGHWRGWYTIEIDANALRRLGLHPDQPASALRSPIPPAWRHLAKHLNRR